MTSACAFRLSLAVFCFTAAASATTIDFEAQGAGAPSAFNTTLNSPLAIGIATFTGGKSLKNEVTATPPSADLTVVYATTGFLPNYTDPLVISFSQPVSNVSLMVTNETADTYTLADNAGHLVTLAIGTNENETLTLADAGITQVTIATLATVGWDFAIDNVSFTSTAAPEPSTALLTACALVGLLWCIYSSRVRNQSDSQRVVQQSQVRR
jgi:hypothetical protein